MRIHDAIASGSDKYAITAGTVDNPNLFFI